MTDAEIQKLVDYVTVDATCPLCNRTDTCVPGCDYHEDYHEDYWWNRSLPGYYRLSRATLALRKES